MEQGTAPVFSVENISPELAAYYLTFNTANRPKKKAKIEQYARDMAAGQWLMTAEPIKFSPDGILRDGQNRLHAIVLAERTVTMVVARNVPVESMVVMDAGAPRTKMDALGLSGFAGAKDLAAAVNAHNGWKSGQFAHAMSNPGGGSRLSNIGVVTYAKDHPELIEAASFAKPITRFVRVPVGAIAVAYDAFVSIDPDEALEFFDRIREMRTAGHGDPIATLLRRTQSDTAMQRRMFVATGLYYLFRTWNAIRTGEPLVKLQVGSAERGWTAMPEPK